MKLVESFEALDQAGNPHQIDLYQEYQTVHTLGGVRVVPGMQRYTCRDSVVSPLKDGRFHIIKIDTIVERVA